MNRVESQTIENRVRRLIVSGILLSLLAYLTFAYAATLGRETLGVVPGGIVAGAMAFIALILGFSGFCIWSIHWKTQCGDRGM